MVDNYHEDMGQGGDFYSAGKSSHPEKTALYQLFEPFRTAMSRPTRNASSLNTDRCAPPWCGRWSSSLPAVASKEASPASHRNFEVMAPVPKTTTIVMLTFFPDIVSIPIRDSRIILGDFQARFLISILGCAGKLSPSPPQSDVCDRDAAAVASFDRGRPDGGRGGGRVFLRKGDFERDYVTKPFSPRELRARIKTALRRTEYRFDG
jgi:hypothetical protein